MSNEVRFVAVPYDLLKADGYVNKDGDFIPLSLIEKMIYSYVYSRWKYFVKEKKGDYYDTQESIADGLNIDRRSVMRKLKQFMEEGIVKGEKVKFSNYMNWKYTNISELKLWKEVDGKKEMIVPVKYEKKTVKPPKQNIVIPMLGEDSCDLPF